MKRLEQRYTRHIIVCVNEREDGDCCGKKEGPAIYDQLKDYVKNRGLAWEIRITRSRCLGFCQLGPTLVVYPDQHWYTHVTVEDIPDIIDRYVEKKEEA